MSNKETIIGHGAYRYRVIPDWGRPAGNSFPVKDCHEMVIDKQGRLYLLTNDCRNNIIVYNKNGKVINVWGNRYPGAHGLTLQEEAGQEYLFITDTIRHEIIKTDLQGNERMIIGYPAAAKEYTGADLYKPTETAIAGNGDIYVTDGYGLQYVIQYSSTGEYIRHWGGAAQFDCAHGIALDTRSGVAVSLLVTSRNENAIKRFSLDGIYQDMIHLPGSFVCRPVIHGMNIYAAVFRSEHNKNEGSGYVTILDAQNKVVSTPGGTAPVYEEGKLLPQQKSGNTFIHPHDVCIDEEENVYVPQWNSSGTYPVKLERIHSL